MKAETILLNRRAFLAASLFGAGLVSLPCGSAIAAARRYELPKVDYLAERRVERGNRWQTMRVHYSPSRERMELQGSSAAGNSLILRRDLGRTWIVMPLLRSYGDAPLDVGAELDRLLGGLRLTPDGREQIDGVAASRHRADGEFRGRVWLDPQNIILRAEGEARIDDVWQPTKVEQRQIRLGAHDPSLFELPPGYSRLDLSDPRWSALVRQIISGR